MNLQDIKTKTGKTMQDFSIPEKLIKEDTPLVQLILESESMDDGERQYWFNLSEVMNSEQVEKLRDILVREKQKLAEIEAKYSQGEKKEDPALAMQRAQESGARRAEQRAELKAKEASFEAEEEKHQDSLLEKELANL
jgi:hypothetical protein